MAEFELIVQNLDNDAEPVHVQAIKAAEQGHVRIVHVVKATNKISSLEHCRIDHPKIEAQRPLTGIQTN